MTFKNKLTRYGFEYGPMKVTRIGQIKGNVEVSLKAGKTELFVSASPAGQSVRVFDRGGVEWKPLLTEGADQ